MRILPRARMVCRPLILQPDDPLSGNDRLNTASAPWHDSVRHGLRPGTRDRTRRAILPALVALQVAGIRAHPRATLTTRRAANPTHLSFAFPPGPYRRSAG